MALADETKLRSRRSLLAAAAAGAAAAAAAAIAPASVAAASTAVMTEVDNPANGPMTSISNASALDGAFGASASGSGTGVLAQSVRGMGALGTSEDTTDPANNSMNAGVVGVAGETGSVADNIGLTGVYGYADPSLAEGFVGAGVWGDSPDIGVIGTGATGVQGVGIWGVQGYTEEPGGVAVYAQSADAGARALRVEGRAEFTRSGRVSMGSGTSTKKVSLAGCTSNTMIMAMMASNRSGRWVRAVVPTTGSFTIYLNGTLSSAAYVVWIALTNPSNHAG
jgi:hypothetical protein